MEQLDGRREKREKPEDLGTLVRRLRIKALSEHAQIAPEENARG